MLSTDTVKALPQPMCQHCLFSKEGCTGACHWQKTDICHLSEKETLFYEGDKTDGFIEITAGVVKVTKYLPDGRRFIIGFFYPGAIIGLSAGGAYTYTAEAVTRVSYKRFRLDRLNSELHESPEIAARFIKFVCAEFDVVQDHMMLLARKSPIEKIATFLLQHAERMQTLKQGFVQLPMSRSDMADHLGLTIETVCRVLTKLRTLNIITVDHIKTIHFTNLEALREYAEGDESFLAAA